MATNTKTEEAMLLVGKTVAERHVEDNMVVGLGSGSAIAKFANALGEVVRAGNVKGISVVPSSMQAWLLARENSLRIVEDSAHSPAEVDLVVDGADQISLPGRSMIKGGGGALLREKILLSSAKAAMILVVESKVVDKLERSVPVEVVQFALNSVQAKIKAELNVVPTLRKLDKGYPFFTESGNVILDCKFEKPIANPVEAEKALKVIPGVVEAGIFNCHVRKFYIGAADGSIKSR
jgi:ribose 5-phosphate isomerase A